MSFIFDIQTFATTYTTTAQTQTTATPIDTETTTTPTIIVMSEKTLVDKEHAERYVRKTIEFVKKHAFDGVKLVTDKEIDDFFDKLEEEAAAELNADEENFDDGDTSGGSGDSDTQEGGGSNP